MPRSPVNVKTKDPSLCGTTQTALVSSRVRESLSSDINIKPAGYRIVPHHSRLRTVPGNHADDGHWKWKYEMDGRSFYVKPGFGASYLIPRYSMAIPFHGPGKKVLVHDRQLGRFQSSRKERLRRTWGNNACICCNFPV